MKAATFFMAVQVYLGDSSQVVCDAGIMPTPVDTGINMAFGVAGTGTSIPPKSATDIIGTANLNDTHTGNNYFNYSIEFPKATKKKIETKKKQQDSSEFNFPCTKCNKAFKRGDHLKRHILNVHDQDNPYHCGDCSKGFANIDFLLKHNETSHFGVVSKGPFCAWCNLKFASMDDLQSHARSMHATDDVEYMKFINKTCGVFGCPFCQKTVSNEKILARHIEKIHKDGSKGSASQLGKHKTDVHKNNDAKKSKSKKCKGPSLNGNDVLLQAAQNNQLSNSMQNGTLNNSNPAGFTSTMHSYAQQKSTLKQGQIASHAVLSGRINNVKMQVKKAQSANQSAQDITLRKIYSLDDNMQLNTVSKPESVSEALSSAMKALSDFSYDDLSCHAHDYVPAGFSTFQSSSPIPTFHYPTSVQCSNITDDEQFTTQPTSMDSFTHTQYAGNTTAAQNTHSAPQNSRMSHSTSPFHAKTSIQSQNPHSIQKGVGFDGASLFDDHLQARRGRPKKRKTESDEIEEQSNLQMFIKPMEKESFFCEICSEMFDNVSSTMHHIESVHLVAKPQECCICRKRFAQAGNVKRHIRFVHLRERPFQCSDCASTFDRLCYLQRHMRCHIDTNKPGPNNYYFNPCNCPECGKRCLTVLHLKGHLQRRHYPKSKKCSKELEDKYGHIFQAMEDCVTLPLLKNLHSSEKSKLSKSNSNTASPNKPFLNASGNNAEADVASIAIHSSSSDTITQKLHKESNSIKNSGSELKSLSFSTPSEKIGKNQPICSKIAKTNVSKTNVYRRFYKNATFSILRCKKVLGHGKRSSLLPFKCHICACRSFPSLCLLKSHVAVVHHSTMRRHLCLHCGHSFLTKSSLLDHKNKRHQSRKLIVK